MRALFIGAWAIAVISVSALVWFTKSSQTNQHVYYTSVISEGDSNNQITLFGKIWIDQETTLVPLTDGNVVDVLVKAGDFVKAGTALATLDFKAEDLEQYERLKKLTMKTDSIDNLNRSLVEITKLEEKGFYDALDASKKRAEVYASISQIMTYKENLQKQFDATHGKILRAPFDGVVTDVRLRRGQRVSTTDEKFDISISIAPKNYKVGVELEVSDELLFKMKKNQEITVSVPLSQDSSFRGKIQSISQQAYDDKKKRFFKVLGEVYTGKSKNTLASGMKVVIDVKTKNEDNLTWIPKAAIDIHLDDGLITSKLNFIKTSTNRTIASSKGDDFNAHGNDKIDALKEQSTVSRLAGNEAFPLESSITEIYVLTPDNKVVEVTIQKVRESGEMIAVEGKDLRGMRVITHYRPKETLW